MSRSVMTITALLGALLLAGKLGDLGCTGQPRRQFVERRNLRQGERATGNDLEARVSLTPEGREVLPGTGLSLDGAGAFELGACQRRFGGEHHRLR